MSRKSRWGDLEIKDGIGVVELSSWKYFHDYVRQEMLDFSHYVWRGQRDASWVLRTSLDRQLQAKPKKAYSSIANEHLSRFKLAVRGRRGTNPSILNDENEWWAIAQHNGMATPLLDWTDSAFVALYFAFEKAQAPSSGKRAVWALNGKFKDGRRAEHEDGRANSALEFIRPMQDENARLVSQSGMFSRVPYGYTVESWVKECKVGETARASLIKLEIPNDGRPECLRTLNRMNINHLSLFPDVYGAGQHCNKWLEIDKY
jgi:hypothetical protein